MRFSIFSLPGLFFLTTVLLLATQPTSQTGFFHKEKRGVKKSSFSSSSSSRWSGREIEMGVERVDFLVVGVQKGGTSSLGVWLSSHPQIIRPEVKELLYWTSCNKSISKYLGMFPNPSSIYGKEEDTKRLVGEFSASYFYHGPSCLPRLLKSINPEMKIIILFREPGQRVISHFNEQRDRCDCESGGCRCRPFHFLTEKFHGDVNAYSEWEMGKINAKCDESVRKIWLPSLLAKEESEWREEQKEWEREERERRKRGATKSLYQKKNPSSILPSSFTSQINPSSLSPAFSPYIFSHNSLWNPLSSPPLSSHLISSPLSLSVSSGLISCVSNSHALFFQSLYDIFLLSFLNSFPSHQILVLYTESDLSSANASLTLSLVEDFLGISHVFYPPFTLKKYNTKGCYGWEKECDAEKEKQRKGKEKKKEGEKKEKGEEGEKKKKSELHDWIANNRDKLRGSGKKKKMRDEFKEKKALKEKKTSPPIDKKEREKQEREAREKMREFFAPSVENLKLFAKHGLIRSPPPHW